MNMYFSVTTVRNTKIYVSVRLATQFLAGFIIFLAVAFAGSNPISLAQSSDDLNQWRQQTLNDINTEIPLIQKIEEAIDPVLKSETLAIKDAESLRVALDEFEKFQQENGYKYVMGSPGNAFHTARNIEAAISSELDYLKSNDGGNIPDESRNSLVFWKDKLKKIRGQLLKAAEDFEAVSKEN